MIDISDPTDIVAKDSENDIHVAKWSCTQGLNSSCVLNAPYEVDTFVIGSSTYAIVTSAADDGVQIIDISDPTAIVGTDSMTDGGSLELDGAYGVDTFVIGSSTYAIVTASADDGCGKGLGNSWRKLV